MISRKSPTNNLVSIIMPVYNGELYCAYSIQSVCDQTYTHWELLIVDDGSEDNTKNVIKPFLKLDNRIRYIFQENRGPAAARNTAINCASGQFIAFIDADDLWANNKLKNQLLFFKKNPDYVVYGSSLYLYTVDGKDTYEEEPRVFENFDSLTDNIKYLMQMKYLSITCAVVIPRYMLDDVGIFDETLNTVEDADLWFRLAQKYKFHALSEVVFYRRKHSSSITTTLKYEQRLKNKYYVLKKNLYAANINHLCLEKNIMIRDLALRFTKEHYYVTKKYWLALQWFIKAFLRSPLWCSWKVLKRIGRKFS